MGYQAIRWQIVFLSFSQPAVSASVIAKRVASSCCGVVCVVNEMIAVCFAACRIDSVDSADVTDLVFNVTCADSQTSI
jgi:hypothetical protein